MPAHKRPAGPKPDTFGWRLRAARLAVGIHPRKLARKLDVAVSTYYSWEANERTPRDIAAVASAVKSTVGALFGEAA